MVYLSLQFLVQIVVEVKRDEFFTFTYFVYFSAIFIVSFAIE